MAKENKITAKELSEWMEGADATYASSSRENKRLTTGFNGKLRVTVAGKTIYEGKSIFDAVEAYNNITEKYTEPVYKL